MISIYFALILEIMFSCIYEEKNSVQITIFISIKKKSKSRNHLSEERNRQNQWQTYLSFATYLRRIKRKKHSKENIEKSQNIEIGGKVGKRRQNIMEGEKKEKKRKRELKMKKEKRIKVEN